jgi:hypothetical protein
MRKFFPLATIAIMLGCNRAAPTAPSIANASGTSQSHAISIAGASTLTRGTRTQFKAVIVGPTGDFQDVTSQAVWEVDNLAVASIEGDGWLSAKTPGATQVTARFQKVEGRLTITVSAGSESQPAVGDPSTPTDPNTPPGSSAPPGSEPTPSQCLPTPLPPNPPNPIPRPFPVPTTS